MRPQQGVERQIAYFTTKDFDRSLSKAFLAGGQSQKKAIRVKAVLGSLGTPDPFIGISATNHGESRIENAVKYGLGDGWRLVTQQTEKTCLFLFVGDHEDTEKWLDRQKGIKGGCKKFKSSSFAGFGTADRARERVQSRPPRSATSRSPRPRGNGSRSGRLAEKRSKALGKH